MKKPRAGVLAPSLLLATAVLAAGCTSTALPPSGGTTPAGQSTATTPSSTATQTPGQRLDAAIDSAKAAVDDAAAKAAGLESQASGLRIQKRLQDVSKRLEQAKPLAVEAKKEAAKAIAAGLGVVITATDAAAAKAPQGGTLQTELMDLSAKLQEAQKNLNEAAAGP